MPDYDRRSKSAASTHGKEGQRLRALADELRKIEDRLREIAEEIPLGAVYRKRLPREFHGLYESKRGQKEIESAAVKVGTVVTILRGGADVIEVYDDPV